MAKYRVWSGGDGTGGADNTNWAQAYTTLAAADGLAAAGDFILIHYTHQEALAADTTMAIAAGVTIVAVDKDSSEAYTPMGNGGWVGATGSFMVHLHCNAQCAIYGLTLRNGGSGVDDVSLVCVDGGSLYTEDCYVWCGSTNTGARLRLGGSAADAQSYSQHVNMTVRFGSTSQRIEGHGRCEMIGGGLPASDGSTPGVLIDWTIGDPGGSEFTWTGGDLTRISGTLVDNMSEQATTVKLIQCHLNSSVTVLATQTHLNRSSGEVYVIDCSDNAGTPVRRIWGYYNALGSCIKETGIYFTSGATGWAWKVVGTTDATVRCPFVTPWIDFYNGVNTAITPYIEILRDGSTTAYTDAQVWAEFVAKTTSGSDRAAFAGTDRQTLNAIVAGTAASNQAAGAGTGSWTGEAGSAWSGKCDSGSAFTAQEDGYLRGRIAVAGAITVYVDPQIRT